MEKIPPKSEIRMLSYQKKKQKPRRHIARSACRIIIGLQKNQDNYNVTF